MSLEAGSALAVALGMCAAAAVIEGLCAGGSVKARFAELRQPALSAPLWVWYIIGALYYLIFGFLIYRLLAGSGDHALTLATLALVAAMMIGNALWNYVFFRARNLYVSHVVASLFPVLDIALFACLLYLDRLAALSLVPYLVYRAYAVWWGYGIWKLNAPES